MTYDLSPLFRGAVGFDALARARLAANAANTAPQTYPPYAIEKTTDDAYRISMAVAGFGPDDVDVEVKDNTLHITGRVPEAAAKTDVVSRGFAVQPFARRFALSEHIVVEAADLHNGLLQVALKRVVPEALKPKRIALNAAANTNAVEHQAA